MKSPVIIAVGCGIGLLILAGAVWFLCRQRPSRMRRPPDRPTEASRRSKAGTNSASDDSASDDDTAPDRVSKAAQDSASEHDSGTDRVEPAAREGGGGGADGALRVVGARRPELEGLVGLWLVAVGSQSVAGWSSERVAAALGERPVELRLEGPEGSVVRRFSRPGPLGLDIERLKLSARRSGSHSRSGRAEAVNAAWWRQALSAESGEPRNSPRRSRGQASDWLAANGFWRGGEDELPSDALDKAYRELEQATELKRQERAEMKAREAEGCCVKRVDSMEQVKMHMNVIALRDHCVSPAGKPIHETLHPPKDCGCEGELVLI